LKKIIKKIIWKNTVTIHSVLKKKNYKAKFLINSILKKKIDRDNCRKKTPKKGKKNYVGNTVAIHVVL